MYTQYVFILFGRELTNQQILLTIVLSKNIVT